MMRSDVRRKNLTLTTLALLLLPLMRVLCHKNAGTFVGLNTIDP